MIDIMVIYPGLVEHFSEPTYIIWIEGEVPFRCVKNGRFQNFIQV